MGDSKAVAVERCQEIVSKNRNRNGLFPNWEVLSPLLRGVIRREENDIVSTNTMAFFTGQRAHSLSGGLFFCDSTFLECELCFRSSFAVN
jgi:hypothetical protein